MQLLNPSDALSLLIFIGNVFVAVTGTALLGLCLSRICFPRNPVFRYAVCLSTIVCLLATPILVASRVVRPLGLITVPVPTNQTLAHTPLPVNEREGGYQAKPLETSLEITSISVSVLVLLSIWGMGAMFGIFHLYRGWRTSKKIAAGAQPWDFKKRFDLGTEIPTLYISSTLSIPVAVGIWKPVIIVPRRLTEVLSEDSLREVLLHEGAHIRFRHGIGGVFERSARILFWPHPLVHLLCRDLGMAREEVCDNVASQVNGATCYARTLLTIAQGPFFAPPTSSALALLGPETNLEERIKGLLHPRRNRMVNVERWKIWSLTSIVVLSMLGTVGVRLVSAQETPTQKAEDEKRVAEAAADNALQAKLAAEKAARTATDSTEDAKKWKERALMAEKRLAEANIRLAKEAERQRGQTLTFTTSPKNGKIHAKYTLVHYGSPVKSTMTAHFQKRGNGVLYVTTDKGAKTEWVVSQGKSGADVIKIKGKAANLSTTKSADTKTKPAKP